MLLAPFVYCNLYVTACIPYGHYILISYSNPFFLCFENAYLAWQHKTFCVSPVRVSHGIHPGCTRINTYEGLLMFVLYFNNVVIL